MRRVYDENKYQLCKDNATNCEHEGQTAKDTEVKSKYLLNESQALSVKAKPENLKLQNYDY